MAGTINIPLLSVFNDKGVRDAIKGFAGLSGALKTLTKTALAGYTGMQLLNKSVDFISNSANAARDLQRNMAGVTTIFGANTAEMQKFIATSESMGMSQAQAAQATAFLGSVFKQTGMPMDKVMEQTKTMVSLGADLASTYGYSVSEALTAMTATFRGEYDPIEKFGVAMKQQQVNAQLAAMGMGNLKGQALIAAQQQVRYNMILQRTSDAQGAFARQSGNLFEQQQILQAVWTDMQATLGKALIPALTQLLGAISPLISSLVPHLVTGFQGIADSIANAAPKVADISKSFNDFADGLSVVIPWLTNLAQIVLPFMAQNIAPILVFFAVFRTTKWILGIWSSVAAMQALAIAQKKAAISAAEATVAEGTAAVATTGAGIAAKVATPAVTALTVAMDANVVGLFALGIAGLVAVFLALKSAADKANDAIIKTIETTGQIPKNAPGSLLGSGYAVTGQQRMALNKYAANPGLLRESGQAAAEQRAADAKAKAIADAKQKKMLADLANLGKNPVSTGSTSSKKAATDAAAKKAAADRAKALKDAADAAKAFADDVKASAVKLANDLSAAYDKIVTDAKAFKESFSAVTDAFKDLAKTAPVLGQFEQQTSDALQSLRDQAKDAFSKGLLGTGITADKALAELNKLVTGQEALLTDYAKQRDVLAKKIDIARQISGSILSYGNITSTLNNIKKDVIQTTTQIIDGVSVSISQSVNDIKAADLVGEYQKILDKTKDFAKNLKALKAAGLDSGLFKQIVDAGVESGGVTAAAIVSGGADTISELNSLFADLQTTGSDIAATTTDIMYNNGGEIVNGFIQGLMSEDARLQQLATDMATSFSVTFTNSIMAAIQSAIDAAQTALSKAVTPVGKLDVGQQAYVAAQNAYYDQVVSSGGTITTPDASGNIHFGRASTSSTMSTPVILQVDGKTLATSLITYTRTNGSIAAAL